MPLSNDLPLRVSAAIAARWPAFLANGQSDLIKLHDALAAGDFAAIQTIGHNCKGIGTGYGFPAFTEVGLEIEKAAKARDADEVRESIRVFERHISTSSD